MHTICSSNALPELSDCKPQWEQSKDSIKTTQLGSVVLCFGLTAADSRVFREYLVSRPHWKGTWRSSD